MVVSSVVHQLVPRVGHLAVRLCF